MTESEFGTRGSETERNHQLVVFGQAFVATFTSWLYKEAQVSCGLDWFSYQVPVSCLAAHSPPLDLQSSPHGYRYCGIVGGFVGKMCFLLILTEFMDT